MNANEPQRAAPPVPRTSAADVTSVTLGAPCARDGQRVYEAVRSWGGLDVNSAYAYLLACDRFAGQCSLAQQDGRLLGFVVGLAPSDAPHTLFVWQVAVSPAGRGLGLASRLIDDILARDPARYRFVEAHVGPNNQASMRLFEGLARRYDAPFEAREDYPAAWFPDGHDAECLVRIGPLREQGETP